MPLASCDKAFDAYPSEKNLGVAKYDPSLGETSHPVCSEAKMIKPQPLDVIELLTDLPNAALQAGDLGTILEEYDDSAYEIEFANSEGETLALQVLGPDQFVVVWQNSTKTWVSLTDRVSAIRAIAVILYKLYLTDRPVRGSVCH